MVASHRNASFPNRKLLPVPFVLASIVVLPSAPQPKTFQFLFRKRVLPEMVVWMEFAVIDHYNPMLVLNMEETFTHNLNTPILPKTHYYPDEWDPFATMCPIACR